MREKKYFILCFFSLEKLSFSFIGSWLLQVICRLNDVMTGQVRSAVWHLAAFKVNRFLGSTAVHGKQILLKIYEF